MPIDAILKTIRDKCEHFEHHVIDVLNESPMMLNFILFQLEICSVLGLNMRQQCKENHTIQERNVTGKNL